MSTLCMMRGGSCWSLSILSLWCHDRAALTSDTDVLATINRYSTESYSPNLGAGCAPAPLKIADVVGGLAHNGAGQVISGDALYGLYWVQNNGKTENGRKVDRPAEAFEDKLLDMLETFSSNTFVLSYQTTRSRSDAFGGAIAGDISLVSSGYFLIIGYAVSRMAFTVCSSLRHSTTAAHCATAPLQLGVFYRGSRFRRGLGGVLGNGWLTVSVASPAGLLIRPMQRRPVPRAADPGRSRRGRAGDRSVRLPYPFPPLLLAILYIYIYIYIPPSLCCTISSFPAPSTSPLLPICLVCLSTPATLLYHIQLYSLLCHVLLPPLLARLAL